MQMITETVHKHTLVFALDSPVLIVFDEMFQSFVRSKGGVHFDVKCKRA